MFTTTICADTEEITYTYEEYLQSEHWIKFRERYITTFGDNCECCGVKGEQLHHISYDNLGNEDFEDVIFLCSSCHKWEHNLE